MITFRHTKNIVSLFIIASIAACATAPHGSDVPNEKKGAESICSDHRSVRRYDRQLEKLEKKATHTARVLARGENLEDAARVEEACRDEFTRHLEMSKQARCVREREDELGKYCEEYETPRCGAIFQDIDVDVKEAQLQKLTVQISQIKTARGTAYAKCLASMSDVSPQR